MPGPERRRARDVGVRELLARRTVGDPQEKLDFATLLSGLGLRAFGMLLLLSILPAFIPVPIGGAVSGPLVMLVGLQLLLARRRPWLPKWLSRHGPQRDALRRFQLRIDPWLARLERLVKPRATALLHGTAATAFTGVLLLLLGLLLSLPIPLTNYLFGGLLLLYALALLERDGLLMGVAWALGVVTIVVFGVLSGSLVELVSGLWARFN
ncbi:MAG: exopolysaccharide biosynthesis protein [Pseudoxanthomonas suwonensis]|nr:exopolysaccharide biosynthesis protein [Pseudoxanthomonas suwonensis]